MKMFLKLFPLFSLCAGVSLLSSCSGGLKKEYKMQVTVGPENAWGQGAAYFAEKVSEYTDGQVTVKPYYGSQLLKGAQLNAAQMVSSGAIDCALDSTINMSPMFPEMNVFALPFFVNDYESADKLEAGQTGQKLFADLKGKGLIPLAWGENGFRQLTNGRSPIQHPDDLLGLKVRVVGSPIFIDVFRQYGANPVNMNWGDAVTAFQQGTVDGQENPVEILTAVQIGQYHKYALFWNYAIDPLVLYWSQKSWDRFPAEIQAGIQKAALEAGQYQKALARVGLDDGTSLALLNDQFNCQPEIPDPVAWLEEHGVTVYTPNEFEAKAFHTAALPVHNIWAEKLGPDFMQMALDDLGR